MEFTFLSLGFIKRADKPPEFISVTPKINLSTEQCKGKKPAMSEKQNSSHWSIPNSSGRKNMNPALH